nr:39S ribosomal protein L9, mitochondrial isoform X1 [Osmia lignaria]
MLKCIRPCINSLNTRSATLLCNQNDLLMQQTRNTFILKRRFPVPLMKKGQRYPRLKHKHYLYDLVENTNTKKHPLIDLILLDTVKDAGERGELIKVKSLTAYHHFLLPKLAVYATPENIEKYLIQDEDERKKFATHSSQFVQNTISLLSECCLSVTMNMDVPWTIEKWHVSANFRNAGFIVPQHAITLPEKAISGPDLSVENKEFYVTVKVNNCEETKVRCRVHHYTNNPSKKITYEVPYWQLPSAAIFPEDEPVLNSLPKYQSSTKTKFTKK